MIRQSTDPIPFAPSRRADNRSARTSGRAGEAIPVTYAPMLRGDSCAGQITIGVELAEMPKPLENAVMMRAQLWAVPRPALPQFSGPEDYVQAYHGKSAKILGASDRTPPALFDTIPSGSVAAAESSEIFRALGITLRSSTAISTDLVDSYNLIMNYRLAAHSSKPTRYNYYQENADALQIKPAFWPKNRFTEVVPDYESALVTGSLDLQLTSGSLPIEGIMMRDASDNTWRDADGTSYGSTTTPSATGDFASGGQHITGNNDFGTADTSGIAFRALSSAGVSVPDIVANLTGGSLPTTLADIDVARKTQAMAKAVAGMRGQDFSGFEAEDVILSELMQGFQPPEWIFNRPWLIDSKTAVFGMNERHSTGAADDLDDSVTIGRAQVTLSCNVPKQDYGALLMATVEVMPERLFERQNDPWLEVVNVDDLPNQMRDSLNTEPVDIVENARIDAKHTTPGGTYGYEPLNKKWDREFTVLGGEFRQLTPGTPNTTARTALWQVDYVDPAFTTDHYVCEHPFPQNVFSAPGSDVCKITVNQRLTITGQTVFGSSIVEDNQDLADVIAEQP